jgi:pyridoxine kinase
VHRLVIVWFINLTGYFRAGGTKATAEDLERMFFVMEQNGLLKPARILTGGYPITYKSPTSEMDTDIDVPSAGYIFGAEALSVVADTVTKLLQHNPQIVYLLDRKQSYI